MHIVVGVVALDIVVLAGPVLATCEHFGVTVSPAAVAEGAPLTVTVSRSGPLGPSQIDVSSVDETARAGRDYPAVQRTVSFTTETRQSFTLATTNDKTPEGNRTFRVHLSHPSGCAVDNTYVVDGDARVTITEEPGGDTGPHPSNPTVAAAGAPASNAPGNGSSSDSAGAGGSSSSVARPKTSTSATTTTADPQATEEGPPNGSPDAGAGSAAGPGARVPARTHPSRTLWILGAVAVVVGGGGMWLARLSR